MFKWAKRKWLSRRPFPDEWRPHLRKRVPWYAKLEPALKRRFEDMLKVFIWEKYWEGARGMEITDEVRVTIGAAAVRLVLHLGLSRYDRLTEIVVYPFAYKHPNHDAGVLGGEQRHGGVLGEAHTFGTVVLSWPAVTSGMADERDGHETASHEFAHVLDVAGGQFDGTPELDKFSHYKPWAEVMEKHFIGLQKRKKRETKVLRKYGATNEAEFFAVATESFFEKPQQMKRHTPDLYGELSAFYGYDPADNAQAGAPNGRDIGRNDSCPCGSNKKHKKCCGFS